MSRTLPEARAPKDPALKLLKADHEEVKVLFDEYEDTDEPDERQVVADRLRGLLTVHATIEEEIFYPALREAFDDADHHLLEEAAVEHEAARELIAKLAAATDVEREAALVRVLGEYVRHHADEEEDEIFPRARETELDQAALAAALAARKQELMAELGIGEDEEPDDDELDDEDWDDDDADEFDDDEDLDASAAADDLVDGDPDEESGADLDEADDLEADDLDVDDDRAPPPERPTPRRGDTHR